MLAVSQFLGFNVMLLYGGTTDPKFPTIPGAMYGAGANSSNQLGLQGSNVATWTQAGTDVDWINARCGLDFSVALKSNGLIYATGHNNRGQCGQGNTSNVGTFTLVTLPNPVVYFDVGDDFVVVIDSLQ